ncbi:MAG: hypothetical protein HKN03_17025 [Acidimicrobiales bacterium]|nr:hypothetical protein [Acidimicrobiales bacterium]
MYMFGFGKKKKKVKAEPEVHLIPPLDTPAVVVDDAGETVSPDRVRIARVESYSEGMIFAYGHHTGLAGAIVERDWTARSLGTRLYRILNTATPGGTLDLKSPVLPSAEANLGKKTALKVEWAPHGENKYQLIIRTEDASKPDSQIAITVTAEEFGRRIIELLDARPAALPELEPLPDALSSSS